MIKLKINPLDSKLKDIEYIKGETISKTIERVSKSLNISEEILNAHLSVYLNGELIDKDFYSYVKPSEKSNLLLAVTPRGGSFGETFKIVAVIVVAAVVSSATAGLGSPVAAGLITAGATIGTSLLLNAIIPPPKPSMSGPSSLSGQSESQAYSVTGQSNSVSKYGVVPKVYGKHRAFPTIAANPYIKIENRNGKQEQFFFAIYDFGYGPMTIDNLKIGDTSIGNFKDVEYRFVDINRPDSDEGVWDAPLKKTFEIYKGEVEVSPLALGINIDGQQVISSSSINSKNYSQQIELFFTCPQGLIGYDTSGNSSNRTVEFEIELSNVGENNWYSFSDPSFVYDGKVDSDEVECYFDTSVFSENFRSVISVKNIPISSYGGTTEYDAFVQYVKNIYSGDTFTLEEVTFGLRVLPMIIINRELAGGEEFYDGANFLGYPQNGQSLGNGYYRYQLNNPNNVVLYTKDIHGTVSNTGNIIPVGSKTYYGDYLGVHLNNNIPAKHPYSPYLLLGGRTGSNIMRISANTANPYFTQVTIKPRSLKQQDIRVRRVRSYGPSSFSTFDNVTWSSVQTRFDTTPIKTKNRHTFLELKIRATEQLNGTIQDLSAEATSVLDTWDGSAWVKKETSNPAWVFVDILTGELNKRALDKSDLDIDSIYEWSQYCDEIPQSNPSFPDFVHERFASNFVLDYSITVRELLDQLCGAANASINLYNGKYGVLIDTYKSIPVQLITNRNSSSFSSVKTFVEEPDAINIKYVDPQSEWNVNTIKVYSDGKNFENSTTFEDFDAFAVTNVEQAFRYGRYLQAQAKLRQEIVTIKMDFEHLVATRGDLVYYQQDAMRIGGQPVRIKSVIGNVVKINDSFTVQSGVNYGYTYRSKHGEIKTDTMNIISSDEAELNGEIPEVGDLLVWGEIDKIITKWLVKTIAPNDDLSATLTLVEYNEAIYTSESDEFIADYNANLSGKIDSEIGAPSLPTNLQVLENSWDCNGSNYEYFVRLSWDAPNDVYELFEVYQSIDGEEYELYTVTKSIRTKVLIEPSGIGKTYSFKVLSVASSGAKKALVDAPVISEIPLGKTTFPSDVDALYINVTSETILLNWDLLDDCDIQDYLIRYSPLNPTEARWDKSSPLETASADTSSVMAQARTGTYLIKARDWNGKESANASIAFTSIPELSGLNAIDIIEDVTFDGTLDRCEFFGDTLILKDKQAVIPSEYEEEGFYYFTRFLDLGEIYTVRLRAELVAGSFNKADVIANWVTLASVSQMSSATGADYQVDLEYRARDSYNVIAEWDLLSNVTDMAGGESGDWTPWRRITSGDFTGRIFQFRIRLRSYKEDVSPQVFSARILADMPDRIINGENKICPVGGIRVLFDPELKGPIKPNVQITQDNAQPGDRYVVKNVDVTGFDIEFFDSLDNSVQRQYDYAALGYGRKTLTTL